MYKHKSEFSEGIKIWQFTVINKKRFRSQTIKHKQDIPSMKVTVLWGVITCTVIDLHRSFG
jgi:hypothetical protein